MSPTSVVQMADAGPVRAPAPGVAVLACRCGRVLDAEELCRPLVRYPGTGGVSIEPIVCGVCAVAS